ncbi:hypothetical protein AQUCO_04400009v1 [Aquilegia coerulea]|uniref:Argonaute linker 1 domain-containing protein n=1 Tax=Aquilegia coerulea TaxID=218851 RepID=A0A2G5CNU5_AQUCA|nr:hypothetical protein AQUCO_04400009v1 [Aquilegia coerulea]
MEKLVSEETGVTRPPPAPNLPLYAMAESNFAYDGEKALYTRGAIPQKQMEFTVKRFGSPGAAKIPMGLVALTFKGFEIENTGDALGLVIDIILRQQAAKRCFLVQKSFHDDVRDMVDVGGATACRGFHSRFRTTQGGLSLNMDVSSTMILTLGPVFTNPNLEDPH